jgi:hypothetical protein
MISTIHMQTQSCRLSQLKKKERVGEGSGF